jgi:hypothetical protein
MDAHEALFFALLALTMAADVVKQHLGWTLVPMQLPLETWSMQPPCLDAAASIGCVLALAS